MPNRNKELYTKLQCSVCGFIIYTRKNKKKNPAKLELKKHCKMCRKHQLFKETK